MAREVVVVGHGGAVGIELTAACEVLELANVWLAEQGRPPAYEVQVMTLDGGPLPLFGGLELSATGSLRRYRGPVDTLIVVGGPVAPAASENPSLARAVGRASAGARRVVSLCTGAFVLAAAGLLDGRRVTTHWRFGEDLAARYPAVEVDTDPIYVRDGPVWTSAGITAGIDLLLALVEEDEGSEVAREIARLLVIFLRRTGSQAQFSAQLCNQLADRHPIRELQQYIAEHPEADLSLPALARRVNMSPRHFARLFRSETGVSPGRYVEQARIETARRRLEESEQSVEAIAAACGFGSAGNFRRVFAKAMGVSPFEYRRGFGPARPSARRDGLDLAV
ncbi:MAG: GlxA family transcriptional regulator [Actinomycetota bacterium]|jgi:transcriptional regulator GlxA family with amidase domain